jgi:hypothetical protein
MNKLTVSDEFILGTGLKDEFIFVAGCKKYPDQ